MATTRRWLGVLGALLATACGAESARHGTTQAAGGAEAAGSAGAFGGGGGAGGAAAGIGGASAGFHGGTAGRGPLAGSAGMFAGGAGTPSAGTAGASVSGGSGGGVGGATGGAGSGGAAAAAGSAGHGGDDGSAGKTDLGPPGADGFAIKVQLASEIKSTAPTTVGIVTWALDKPGMSEAHVDFGLDTTYGVSAPVDLALPDNRTVLVGMKPEKTYHFRIVATDGSQSYSSSDHTLVTGALPTATAVSIQSFKAQTPGKGEKGFFIGSSWSGVSSWTAFIVDTDGAVVWWFNDTRGASTVDGLGRARLSADSRDVWLVRGQISQALERVSLDTLDVQTYPDSKGNHDIAAVSGDTMVYLETGTEQCGIITEIDKAGTTKTIYGPAVPADGYCHPNAIRYSKKQDLYVYSDRKTDVFVVDRAGNLKWKLSDKVSGGTATWGGMQHGVQLLESSLLIFANEVDGSWTNSHAVEFGLDGSLIKRFNSAGGTDWFGDVQRLPNGNTFINYSGRIQEVDPNDNVVFEIDPDASIAYTEFRPSLYGPPIDVDQ